ncbi:MAG: U32 family peptidase [Acidiferrobacterales bacterium]
MAHQDLLPHYMIILGAAGSTGFGRLCGDDPQCGAASGWNGVAKPSTAGIRGYLRVNIERVVLPRVLSLPQVRRIIERINMEVEVLDLGGVEPVRQAQVTPCAAFARNLRSGCFKRAAWLAHSLYLRENPAHWTSIPACN